PFMEKTSDSIWRQLGMDNGQGTSWDDISDWAKLPTGLKIRKEAPMFPRLDVKQELVRVNEANDQFIAKRYGNANNNEQKDDEEIEDDKLITIDDVDKVDLRIAKVVE